MRMKSVLKGEYQLIIRGVHDGCTGEFPVCGRSDVLEVLSENEECFIGRISPDRESSC